MSKRSFKSQASSSRAASSQFAFGKAAAASSGIFGAASSAISYLAEQPDLSELSDANAVVAFKGLSKKDGITKAKALEDLEIYLASRQEQSEELEEAFLEAWIKVYPRLSIDVSRRVRQLSHGLQGQIAQTSGKRVARFMPLAIGSWLAGVHDGDKTVMKSALDALNAVFPTSEKIQTLKKVYQLPILQYCFDCLLKETAHTLSDERTTTQEESETKYSRVVASSLLVITDLLENLPQAEIQKQHNAYAGFVEKEVVWANISSKDAAVRRSILKLLLKLALSQKDFIAEHLTIIASAMLSKVALGRQSGSKLSFSDALLALCSDFPQIWSLKLAGKTTMIERLQKFLKTGSQGASVIFWDNMTKIFATFPEELLPQSIEEASEVLRDIHAGISRKDETRTNLEAAWDCYFSIANRLYTSLPAESQNTLYFEAEFPLVQQYLIPKSENSHWTVTGPRAVVVAGRALRHGADRGFLAMEWPKTADSLLDSIRTSLPEQSNDFDLSQKAVISLGERWCAVQNEALKVLNSENSTHFFQDSVLRVVEGAISVLVDRKGKPYGAAGVVEASLRVTSFLAIETERFGSILSNFIVNELPKLLFSPSSFYLISILYRMQNSSTFSLAWNKSLEYILSDTDTKMVRSTLQIFLGSSQMPPHFTLALQNEALQRVILVYFQEAIDGKEDWRFLSQLLGAPSQILLARTTDTLLADMTESLKLEDRASNTLVGFKAISTSDEQLLHTFLNSDNGLQLLERVLQLTESPNDDIALQASELNKRFSSTLLHTSGDKTPSQSIVNVIRNGLSQVSIDSLSVDTLVDLAKRVMENSELKDKPLATKRVLPDSKCFLESVAPFLGGLPPLQLSITNPLGGAVFLVEKQGNISPTTEIARDQDGYSQALRLALYSVKVIQACIDLEFIDIETFSCVYSHLVFVIQLANDNLSVSRANDLWSLYSSDIEEEMLNFTSEAQSLIASWHRTAAGNSSFAKEAREYLNVATKSIWENSRGLSPAAFYNSRAICSIVSEEFELNGRHPQSSSDLEKSLREYRNSSDKLSYLAFLEAYQIPLSSITLITRICNEIVADLTGLNVEVSSKICLTQLVILNLIILTQEQVITTIAKQRLIFFMKHVIPWLHMDSVESAIKTEICKALTNLLPSMIDVYGTHWAEIFHFMIDLWKARISLRLYPSSANLSLIHASFRLISCLQKFAKDEGSNEDLREAWEEMETSLGNGLLNLLKDNCREADDSNQALRITNEILARLLSTVRFDPQIDLDDLYPLIIAESHAIQRCAFDILHVNLPTRQQEISINAALEKKTVRLPEELLSLVLQAPNPSTSGGRFDRAIPFPIRGYLSSWVLIFDRFKSSSDKVKTDYINQLKEGDYVESLLNFTTDFLHLPDSKPADISKFDVTHFDFQMEDAPLKDVQWILAHIYYLCLTFLPSLTKLWLINAKSRQLTSNVQNWTEKFFSPSLISTTLASVAKWADTQDTSSDDALVIKTNSRTKAITASREIDEQMLSINISLPSDFPFGQVKVEGVSRVAVDEKKWNQWLLVTQGVIKFSDNNVVDGLIAFRRNVNGALKGQSECAICYSIVGADKQLPTKRCGTCKNLFHGSCLYRWFKTSNSSSCPLCRNAFNYS